MFGRRYSLLLVTTLVVFVGLFCEQQAEAGLIGNILPGKYYKKIYDRIGAHLKKTGIEEPADAMQEAINWLETRISRATFSSEKETLSKVLNQLKDLDRLKDDKKCNLESYEKLHANDLATHRVFKWNDYMKMKPTPRIVWLVHNYFQMHANSCRTKYVTLFDHNSQISSDDLEKVLAMRDGYAQSMVRKINTYGTRVVKDDIIWDPPNDDPKSRVYPKEQFTREGFFYMIRYREHSLKNLVSPLGLLDYLARNDQDHQCLVLGPGPDRILKDIERVKALYVKHLVNPCKNYIKQFSGTYQLYEFDTRWFEIHVEDFDLFKSALGFKLCLDLVDNLQEPFFEKMVGAYRPREV